MMQLVLSSNYTKGRTGTSPAIWFQTYPVMNADLDLETQACTPGSQHIMKVKFIQNSSTANTWCQPKIGYSEIAI